MRVLRKGMTGDDVERWQFFLVGQNHQLEVDGTFGGDTLNATSAFQTDNHLDVDGAVGSETLGCAMSLGFDPLDNSDAPANSGSNFRGPLSIRSYQLPIGRTSSAHLISFRLLSQVTRKT